VESAKEQLCFGWARELALLSEGFVDEFSEELELADELLVVELLASESFVVPSEDFAPPHPARTQQSISEVSKESRFMVGNL
jgi:hypothetical protein